MKIDESIENLVLLKKLEDGLGNISGNTNTVTSQSLGCAIDTMRKYQKIKEIISKWDGLCNVEVLGMLSTIMDEVLEDGNDD